MGATFEQSLASAKEALGNVTGYDEYKNYYVFYDNDRELSFDDAGILAIKKGDTRPLRFIAVINELEGEPVEHTL